MIFPRPPARPQLDREPATGATGAGRREPSRASVTGVSTTTGAILPHSDTDRTRRYRERGWWPGAPLPERYVRMVQDRPAALAVLDDRGRRLSREALWRDAGRLSAELAEHGLVAGDVVLIFMPNRVEWQVAMLAALRRGRGARQPAGPHRRGHPALRGGALRGSGADHG